MNHDLTALSMAAAARRDRMQADLTDVFVRHHRRRRMRRRLIATAALALGLGAAATLAGRSHPRAAHPDPTGSIAEGATGHPPVQITRVATDLAAVWRHRSAATFTATILTDEALVDTLSVINRPAGLIRNEAGVRLTAFAE